MSNTTNRTYYTKYKNKGHLRNILTIVLCILLSIGGSSGFMYLTSGRFAKTHGMQDAVQESVNTYLTELYYGDGNGNDSSKESGVVIRSTNSGLTEDEIADLVKQISSLVTDQVMTDLFKDGAIDAEWIKSLEERITEKVIAKIGEKSLTEIEKQAIVNSVVAIIESKLADESTSQSNSSELSAAAAARLEELAQRMTTAESDITTIKSQIEALKKQDTTHTSDIKKLASNYSELKSQYDALAKTLASLQTTTTGDVKNITENISKIQNDIKNINETTNNLSSRIDNIDAQIIQINASITALEKKYDQVIQQYKDLLEEFNTYKNYTNEQLDTLKESLEAFKVEMDDQIKTINTSISELKKYTDDKFDETNEKIDKNKEETDKKIQDLDDKTAQKFEEVDGRLGSLEDRASTLENRTDSLDAELTKDVNQIANIILKLYNGGTASEGSFSSKTDGTGTGTGAGAGSNTLSKILDEVENKIENNMMDDLAAIKRAVASGIYVESGPYTEDIKKYDYVFLGDKLFQATADIAKDTDLGTDDDPHASLHEVNVGSQLNEDNLEIAELLQKLYQNEKYRGRYGVSESMITAP